MRNWSAICLLLWAALLLAGGCSGGTTPASDDPQSGEPGPLTEFAPSRILVQLVDPDDEEEEHDDILRQAHGVRLERIGSSSFFVMHLPPGADPEEALKKAEEDLRVVQSALDYRSAAPEGGPSDAPVLGSDLIGAIAQQANLGPLHLPEAHGITRGAGVLVAVIDTGVDPGHPFLAGGLAPGGFDFIDHDDDPSETRDFIDADGDGLVDEQFGHGTFVASLVLAVAPDCRILPVRVLDDDGYGNTSTVAAGIHWAVDAGARVINVSVDIEQDPRPVESAIDYAHGNDVLVIAAAGNSSLDDVVFPARYGDVVAVGATEVTGVLASFSNFGSQIDLVAPGVQTIGAVPESMNPLGTARWSGTSFATPLVTGVAVLVRARNPGMEAGKVLETVMETAGPVDPLNPGLESKLGAGIPDAAAALNR